MECQLDTEPAPEDPGKKEEVEEQRESSLAAVPADVDVEGQEAVVAHCRIWTCDYFGVAELMVIAARRVNHIGSLDVRHPGGEEVEEVEEGLRLLSKPVDWAWGVEAVVEAPRSLWEVTVRNSVVEQTAPVAEEERAVGWEQLVVGPKEVVVAPGLLRQLEALLRRHLVGRPKSRGGWISAHILV